MLRWIVRIVLLLLSIATLTLQISTYLSDSGELSEKRDAFLKREFRTANRQIGSDDYEYYSDAVLPGYDDNLIGPPSSKKIFF
jgi:hypothetical protein